MTRAFVFLLIILLSFSCKTKKELPELTVTAPAFEVEEPVKEEETPVLDRVSMDMSPIADCREFWKDKERLILQKDDERLKKLIARGDGQITMIVKVNREGEVIEVKIDDKNTTLKESILRGYARETVFEYVFEPMIDGPKVDCGTIRWYLDTK